MLTWELHVMTNDITEDDLKHLYTSVPGHKWENTVLNRDWDRIVKVSRTPRVMLGDNYPEWVIKVINDVDDAVTVITDDLIAQWRRDYEALPNDNGYEQCDWESFEQFLQAHAGEYIFCFSD